MNQSPHRRDPGPTVFGWDEEPAEERPSQFADSTQIGPASGFYRGGAVHPVRAVRRNRFGWVPIVLFLLVLIAVVGAALRWLLPLLHR